MGFRVGLVGDVGLPEIKVTATLGQYGADVDVQDNDGRSPLDLAAETGRVKVVTTLWS